MSKIPLGRPEEKMMNMLLDTQGLVMNSQKNWLNCCAGGRIDCCRLNCEPQKDMWKPYAPVPVDVTLLGNGL
jgi:hypothetical protein